jgi:rhomboid protease GluP
MFKVKEDFITFVRIYPIITLIVGICTAMTVTISLMGGYTSENMLKLGAYESQLVDEGQVWRLLTYSFGHMSYFHFFLNMPFIIMFSLPLERTLGNVKFLVSYIYLCIFAGVMIHYFSNYPTPLAGSSGAGYGLLGMYIYLIFRYSDKFSTYDKRFIIFFVVIGFIMTLLIPGISFAGHIGGFIGGILLSPLNFRKQDNIKYKIWY